MRRDANDVNRDEFKVVLSHFRIASWRASMAAATRAESGGSISVSERAAIGASRALLPVTAKVSYVIG